jgi:hypothetical protein
MAQKKKMGNLGKIKVLAIILVLSCGLLAGASLVQQNQENRSNAATTQYYCRRILNYTQNYTAVYQNLSYNQFDFNLCSKAYFPMSNEVGTEYSNTSACKSAGGRCTKFPEVLSAGHYCATLLNTGYIQPVGTIKTGLCGGDNTVRCCVLPKLGEECFLSGKCIDTGTAVPNGTKCKVSYGGYENTSGYIERGQCAGPGNIACCVAY